MKLFKFAILFLVLGLVCLAGVMFFASFPSSNPLWRLTVVKEKAFGQIPEIPWSNLIQWMRPGSPTYIGALADLPNVNASIGNLHLDANAVEAGARVYGANCRECHGENARGQTGPDLLAAIGGLTDWAFFSTVKWGRYGTAMAPQPLSDRQIWQVHAFIRDSGLRLALGKNTPASSLPPFPSLAPQQILAADNSTDWITWAGDYAGLRHSKLNQISRRNVQDLRLAWAAQLPAGDPSYEASPIVLGGRMIVTQSPEGMTVLNAKTGEMIWDFHRPTPPVALCCGSSNRGVAVLGDTIYVETLDAHLLAFNADTGAKRWDVEVANWRDGFSETGAPLAINNEIVVGVAGGDMAIRGFIAAYSAKDGSLLWKFYTVAGPGDPGAGSWEGDSWKHGGAATWTPGTYDPDLGLIYWGTGNPAPDFSTEGRAGSNLYASCVVAIDAQTGKLKWYFQFEPGDTHDWDATQEPVLVFMANRASLIELNHRILLCFEPREWPVLVRQAVCQRKLGFRSCGRWAPTHAAQLSAQLQRHPRLALGRWCNELVAAFVRSAAPPPLRASVDTSIFFKTSVPNFASAGSLRRQFHAACIQPALPCRVSGH